MNKVKAQQFEFDATADIFNLAGETVAEPPPENVEVSLQNEELPLATAQIVNRKS